MGTGSERGQAAFDMKEIGKRAIWMEMVRIILLMEVNISAIRPRTSLMDTELEHGQVAIDMKEIGSMMSKPDEKCWGFD
jgi:hypothetical protein